eukprot:scaffold64930_cov48-Cyclotella_meneghiniana.AAC.2
MEPTIPRQNRFHLNCLVFIARTTTMGLTRLPQPNPKCVLQLTATAHSVIFKCPTIRHGKRIPTSCLLGPNLQQTRGMHTNLHDCIA